MDVDKKEKVLKDQVSNIGDLVEALVKNANLELNEDVFRKIKHLCQSSSENISHVFYLLMTQLRKEHAEIRYIALIAINALFIRSYEFRKLLEGSLEEFLELTLETNPEKTLPPPKAIAERLKCQAQYFIKSWHLKFGGSCKRLDVAYSFLKKCKNINLDISQEVLNQEVSRLEASVRREISIIKKVCIAKKEIEDTEPEIHAALTEIESCFQLVIPLPNDLFTSSDFSESRASNISEELCHDDAEASDSANSFLVSSTSDEKYSEHTDKDFQVSLRQHGISDMKSNLNIEVNEVSSIAVEENEDNAPVLENLNGLYKQISSIHLPAVLKWSKIFTQGDSCLDYLKRAINLRQLLEAKIAKFKKLTFVSKTPLIDETCCSTEMDDSGSEFVEVEEKEGFEDLVVPEKDFVSSVSMVDNSVHTSELSHNGYKTVDQNSSKLNLTQNPKSNDEIAVSRSIRNPLDQPSTSSIPDWQDPELLEDIEAATGINLKIPVKRKTKNKASKKETVKKNALRTDLKASKNTTYNRLYKKVFKK